MRYVEIIAEIGQNHNGNMDLALEMIHAAKENGADVAKFQIYDAVTLFPKEGNEWFEYNCKTELSYEDVTKLNRECDKVGIEFMASVFDVERIDWLEELGVKRHKVASRSINDQQLINKLAATQKPLLVSLGMWKEEQFPEIPNAGHVDYLYCISQYPTPLENVHLDSVDFNKYAGFSDHTIGISAPITAMVKGARIIEKHLTLDQDMYGPDHSCSITPDELLALSTFRNDLSRLL